MVKQVEESRVQWAAFGMMIALATHFGGSVWLISGIAHTAEQNEEDIRIIRQEQLKRTERVYRVDSLGENIHEIKEDVRDVKQLLLKR